MGFPSLSATRDAIADAMRAKADLPAGRVWLLAMLGGAYIALAGFASTVASCNLLAAPETYGLGRCVAGLLFPVGLIMVVVGGGELFTGNCLMPDAVHRGLVTRGELLRNWLLVYAGNFAGALVVSGMLHVSGSFSSGGGTVAAAVIRTASAKAGLGCLEAFTLGIFCNWLVCLAIWLAARAENAAQKAFVLFFPVWIFVASGYEHSVANMYYLSAGLLAAADPVALAASGLPRGVEAALAFPALAGNLFFVTLGNVAGGAIFVSGAYALACGASRREQDRG